MLMENFIEGTPEISEEDLKIAQLGMKDYIFCENGKSKEKTYFCTRCRNEYTLRFPARTYSTDELNLYDTKHRENAVCARCGFHGELINTGRLKRLSSLNIQKCVAFVIPSNENEVYIRCELIHKNFQNMYPDIYRESYEMYHFVKGKKPEYYRVKYGWYADASVIKPNTFREPFGMGNSYYGFTYYECSFIGLNRLKNTFFKYSLFQEPGHGGANDGFKYLALFSEYPEKVEMLLKCGYEELLRYKIHGWKTRHIVNWKAQNFKDFFKLSKPELNEWKKHTNDMNVIDVYTALFKGRKNGINNAAEWNCSLGMLTVDIAKRITGRFGITAEEILKYIIASTNRHFTTWSDYIDAATDIGYDLTVHNVLFPKNLTAAHDEAVAVRKLKAMEIEQQKARERYGKLMKRYGKENGEYLIRAPHDAAEIINEGNALRHCVGGYAARHANGSTTILFMRAVSRPDKPLYTIEMSGKELRQVHGYKNQTAPDDVPSAKAFFDEWLSWVKSGSPKQKKKIKKERMAATA